MKKSISKNTKVIKVLVSMISVIFASIMIGCGKPEAAELSECEPRIYFQQTLKDYSHNGLHAGGGLSLVENTFIFQPDMHGWIIEGHVRVESNLFSAPPVLNVNDIDDRTTFLIVGTDNPLSYSFNGSDFFDGEYKILQPEPACPLYIGKRNGGFAMAAIRKRGEKETREERFKCNIYATLTYFGFSESDLEKYENFSSIFMNARAEYDFQKIKKYIDENRKC